MKKAPWYQRTHIWSQVNLTENDPAECDPKSYQEYWRRTKTEGVVINCGGIVTYYKSEFPYQYRAKALGEKDYFRLWNEAARQEGLTVVARMDINCTTNTLYEQYPEWYCRNASGEPILSQGRFVACVNGGYYQKFIPKVFEEIIEKYHPDGFADNSWAGSGIGTICYCENCKRLFKEKFGEKLPGRVNWEDSTYRKWVKWNYQLRVDNWRMFNQITQKYGGEDCRWMGMINADPFATGGRFYDIKKLIEGADYIFCDHQSRDRKCGFEQNAVNGNLLRLADRENVIVAESMAHYYKGERTFRLSAASKEEVRTWMMEGIAGQLSVWCHFVGGVTRDPRRFQLTDDILPWISEHKHYLYERKNIARVGVLWNQETSIYYGRDQADVKAAACFRGMTQALSRAGIPFMPVHADDLKKYADRLSVLLLPNVAILSEEQEEAVIDFLRQGRSLILTDETGLYDAEGEWKGPGRLYEELGIYPSREKEGSHYVGKEDWKTSNSHNYVKLLDKEHEIFDFLWNAEVLGFGGEQNHVERMDSNWKKLGTLIPDFPIYPPEFSWIREETDDGSIFCKEEKESRIVYLPADIDRCYGLFHNPDHGKLLGNIVKWATKGQLDCWCEAVFHVNCNVYRTGNKWVIHLVNLAGKEVPEGTLEGTIPLSNVKVRLQGTFGEKAQGIYTGQEYRISKEGTENMVILPVLKEQEILVLSCLCE